MSKKFIENRIVVDGESGEVVQQETQVTFRTTEPDYVKLYIDAWCAFRDIKKVNSTFLYCILPYMTYAEEGQIIGLTSLAKRRIARKLEWKEQYALQNCAKELRKLCVAGILKKIDASNFIVNPDLIGKGEWKDIKNLRATFVLSTGEIQHKYLTDESMVQD